MNFRPGAVLSLRCMCRDIESANHARCDYPQKKPDSLSYAGLHQIGDTWANSCIFSSPSQIAARAYFVLYALTYAFEPIRQCSTTRTTLGTRSLTCQPGCLHLWSVRSSFKRDVEDFVSVLLSVMLMSVPVHRLILMIKCYRIADSWLCPPPFLTTKVQGVLDVWSNGR